MVTRMLSDLIYGVVEAFQQLTLLMHLFPTSTRVGEQTAGTFQHCTLEAAAGTSPLKEKEERKK